MLAKQNQTLALPKIEIEDLGEDKILLAHVTDNPGMIMAGSVVLGMGMAALAGWPAAILVALAAINDCKFAATKSAYKSAGQPVPRKPKDNVVEVDSEPVEEPPAAPTLTELIPKSQRYEDDGRYTQPNPFAASSPVQDTVIQPSVATVSAIDDEPLPTHKELQEMEACAKVGLPYEGFCTMADAMEKMGAPRPTPASLAVTLHYTQSPIEQGVGSIGKALEGDVGSYVVEPLEEPVGKPLEEPDPMQAAKEQVIAEVEKFLEKGLKLEVSRLEQEGSNEWKVVRHAAKVGLSLHWLSLKFNVNKNTKAYKSLEESFTRHGGKVNR